MYVTFSSTFAIWPIYLLVIPVSLFLTNLFTKIGLKKAKEIGADAYSKDAADAVLVAKSLVK